MKILEPEPIRASTYAYTTKTAQICRGPGIIYHIAGAGSAAGLKATIYDSIESITDCTMVPILSAANITFGFSLPNGVIFKYGLYIVLEPTTTSITTFFKHL